MSTLKNVQGTYAKVDGMVSLMPDSGLGPHDLGPREKAAKALEQIKSEVLQAANSNKVPPELPQNTLIAIKEAQTALTADSAPTIARSLQTVGQEVQALEAKLQGEEVKAAR